MSDDQADHDEYQALPTEQQAVYNILGQRGHDHDECMAGVREWVSALSDED